MKKYLLFILFFLLFFINSLTYWNTKNIILELDSSSYKTNDIINLKVSIEWIADFNSKNLVINWLEKFNIISQWFFSNSVILNWVKNDKYLIDYNITTTKDWKYKIWPVTYNNYISNEISFEVSKWNINNNWDKIIFWDNEVNLWADYNSFQKNKLNHNYFLEFLKNNWVLIILILLIIILIYIYYYISFSTYNNFLTKVDNSIKKQNFYLLNDISIQDINFITHLENYFKEYLKYKFNYDFKNNEYTKLKDDLKNIWVNNNKIYNIIDLILLLKYSNNVDDEIKNNLFYLLKTIDE